MTDDPHPPPARPHDPSGWDGYYAGFTLADHLANLSRHAPFLVHLVDAANRRSMLEVGPGSGSMAAFLASLGFRVTAVDISHGVLTRVGQTQERLGGRARLVQATGFALPFPDRTFAISYSQGLLEHFDDEAILALLTEQARVAEIAYASVPNADYRRRDYGDERLLEEREWHRIVSRRLEIVASFQYFRYGRRSRIRPWRRRHCMLALAVRRHA